MIRRLEIKFWVVLVFAILIASLCLGGCALDKPTMLGPLGSIPAMDAYNNVTGQPGADGKTDQAYLDYIRGLKTNLDTASGGATAPASGVAELIITGLSAAAVAIGYGFSKHKQLMQEIMTTDNNVAKVAEKAGVPESHLE